MTKDEKTAYWRQQVDGFQASGLSAKNYCAQEGIAVATRKRLSNPPSQTFWPDRS